jgi:polyphenol oxidase
MSASLDRSREISFAIADLDELFSNAGLTQNKRKSIRHKPRRQALSADAGMRLDLPSRKLKGVEILQVEAWAPFSWLLNGFSTRIGGVTTVYCPEGDRKELNLGFTASDSKQNVIENRRLFINRVLQDHGSEKASLPLVTLQQIHSALVHRVDHTNAGETAVLKGDGLMTNCAGILLGIQTADCIPVLIADRKRKAVAAFHAGWRGTLKRIVQNGVGRMRLEFGSRPKDLVAAIGPGIGQCCYQVGEEVLHEFISQFAYADDLFCEIPDSDPIKEKYPLLFLTARAPGHSKLGPSLHLDLVEANRRQLMDAGLNDESIYVSGECTSCAPDRFFSYRASHGFTGRMLSVIGVQK